MYSALLLSLSCNPIGLDNEEIVNPKRTLLYDNIDDQKFMSMSSHKEEESMECQVSEGDDSYMEEDFDPEEDTTLEESSTIDEMGQNDSRNVRNMHLKDGDEDEKKENTKPGNKIKIPRIEMMKNMAKIRHHLQNYNERKKFLLKLQANFQPATKKTQKDDYENE